jgi:2Fe-2S ferredoxin
LPDQDGTDPVVRVEPLGFEFDVRSGETVMEAALRAGLYWPTVCGGQGYCNRCSFVLEPDHPSLLPMDAEELEALRRVRWRVQELPGERLACRAFVVADVTVRKKGVAVAVAEQD